MKIQWFSNCIGMFNERDKEKSCFRIFVNLLKEEEPVSSDEIAQMSICLEEHDTSYFKTKRFWVGNKKNGGYSLKTRNLEELTNEIEKM